jgi:hypothetical protein
MTPSCLIFGRGESEQTAAWHHCPDFFRVQAFGARLAWAFALILIYGLVACGRHQPRNKLEFEDLTWGGFGCGRVKEQ